MVCESFDLPLSGLMPVCFHSTNIPCMNYQRKSIIYSMYFSIYFTLHLLAELALCYSLDRD